MEINIAERLHPFSHRAGTSCLLPGSHFEIQVFPAKIIIRDSSQSLGPLLEEVCLDIQGPVEDFTVMQNLEKGFLQIWGHAANGFFRYRLHAIKDATQVGLFIEKASKDFLDLSNSSYIKLIDHVKDIYHPLPVERLSLGNHKIQDWDMICRRLDMKEIFPAWFRLGQLTNCFQTSTEMGTSVLLNSCEEAITKKRPEHVLLHFSNLFQAGFDSLLSPRINDKYHQGFRLIPVVQNTEISPLIILKKGMELMRSLFIKTSDTQIHLLPNLPPEFHCGRFLNVSCGPLGTIDMEWSKKHLRRFIFRSEYTGVCEFLFQTGTKQFRLKSSKKDKGQIIPCGTPLKIEDGAYYFFDNFQK